MNRYKRGDRVRVDLVTGPVNGTVTSVIPGGKVWVKFSNPLTGESTTKGFKQSALEPRTHPIILLVQIVLIILVVVAVYFAYTTFLR